MSTIAVNNRQDNFNILRVIIRSIDRKAIILGVMIMVLLASAVSVVYVRDLNRRMFSQLQTLQYTRDKLHVEWGQLLLEESTWATQSRIQRIAHARLDMQLPPPNSIIMVRP